MKNLMAAMLLLFAATGGYAADFPERKQLFSVQANAEVKVKPDRAFITVGINKRTKTLKAGKDHVQKILQDALAFCKKNGVQDKFLQTSYIQIQPEYGNRNDDDETRVHYYEFRQSLSVTLTDISLFEPIVYGLLELGMNTVADIGFENTELRKHRDEARLLAIRAAQEKAKFLTEAAGLKLGRVINLREDGGYFRPSMRRMNMNASQNMVQRGGGDDDSGVAAGMISITSQVDMTYELE